jgi:hypothetical protein
MDDVFKNTWYKLRQSDLKISFSLSYFYLPSEKKNKRGKSEGKTLFDSFCYWISFLLLIDKIKICKNVVSSHTNTHKKYQRTLADSRKYFFDFLAN